MEYRVICVSLDKDLLNIPGWHYNFVTKQLRLVSPLEARRRFYCQIITGDGADGVPSWDNKFRSKQPIFVEKILTPINSMTSELEMYMYAKSLFEEESLLIRNASVLWIQREEGIYWQKP